MMFRLRNKKPFMGENRVNIALVTPYGLSTILFCKQTIRSLQKIPGARLFVFCDPGKYRSEIQSLGAECFAVSIFRWLNPLKDLVYCWQLLRAIRTHKCEIVINFMTKPNIYGTFAAKCARAKSIYLHVVGLGSGFEKRSDVRGRIMRWFFLNLYRIACRCADKIWFTNIRDRQFFISCGFIPPQKAVLSRNYLDTNEYAIELVSDQRKERARVLCELIDDQKLVIMVARLIWSKGIREFVEASKLLRNSHSHLKFILIAPPETGSQDAVPQSFLLEKERVANFKWLGFQSDVKSFYAIADLAVLPTYYKEGGYPRALLEPMAMGKPVIATTSEDCKGAVEEGKNGFLVPVKNAEALAEAIGRIMSDDNMRMEFGTYSRIKASRDFDERLIVPDALRKLGLPIPK